MLVALGSIPRKKELMSNSPEVDLAIFTGKSNDSNEPDYYITIEVTRAIGIVPDIFVVVRLDNYSSNYSYSRVASLEDIRNYGTTPVTANDGYRTSNITIKTNSLSFLKEVKEGIPHVVKDLLDTVKRSEVVEDIEVATTVTIVGED